MEVYNLCALSGLQTLYFQMYLIFLGIQLSVFLVLMITQEKNLYNIHPYLLGLYTIVISMLIYDILFYQIDIVTILFVMGLVYLGESGSEIYPETLKISNYTLENTYNPVRFIVSLQITLIGATLIHAILCWGYGYLGLDNVWGDITNYIYKQPVLDVINILLTFIILGIYISEIENKMKKIIILSGLLLFTLIITYIKYANACGF